MYAFADGFDFYATVLDITAGHWDSGSGLAQLAPGRFTGSRSIVLNNNNANQLAKNSGANDAVHHLTFAFYQSAGLGISTQACASFQLSDGVNAQCTVSFDGNGRIMFYAGAINSTPTVLAQWLTALTASSVWITYEIEIVIHNTTGSITVRRNGNPTADFTATGLNTRGGSANNYANKLTIGLPTPVGVIHQIEDFMWRSDPASVPWVGDIRCYTRMPVSDAVAQFSRAPAALNNYFFSGGGSWGNGPPANTVWATAVTPTFTGNATSILAYFFAAFTGHVNMALYAISGITPGVLLGTCTALTNAATGWQTFTLTAPVAVTKGVPVLMAMISDASPSIIGNNNQNPIYVLAQSYASGFPASMASFTSTTTQLGFSNMGITLVPGVSAQMVNEAQQDGGASYVYDSTVGHGDLYTIAAVSPTPISVVAVTTRGFMEKSDAGTRSAALQLKSGATTAQSVSTPLASNFTWLSRIDTTDPNTGSAWTPAAVDALQIGPVVTA